jgi:hypothetical protein
MAWRWDKKREKAAKLAAEGALTNDQIAAGVGLSPAGFDKWRATPEFRARVDEIVTAYADAIKDEGIANVKNRVAAQNDRWQRMQRLIDAAAEDPDLADIPGGDTGMLVRTAKLDKVYGAIPSSGGEAESLQSAKREVLLYEYVRDTSISAEMRALEKQAAQELGQWTEKQEVTGKDGKPIAVATAPFAFDAYRALFLAAGDGGTPPPGDRPSQSVDPALPDA